VLVGGDAKVRNLAILALSLWAAVVLGACSSMPTALSEAPTLEEKTPTLDQLESLPAPKQKLFGAVYQFADQTGQHKPNPNYADYSSAVTQGGSAILVNALRKAGGGAWFNVLERSGLQPLLQERELIRSNRLKYLGQDGKQLPPLPALLNAGILFQGGIIGYDSDVLTGGLGANYLGIGGDVQYRRDLVSIYLRAVGVNTGEVLESITTSKTIYSVGIDANVFKFVEFQKLFQFEAGFTTNEPVELAVKKAIEKAVYALIVQGAIDGYWHFADTTKEKPIFDQYLQDKGEEESITSVKTITPSGNGAAP
jgi:curli production assembly/transport component CsgG